MTKDMLKSLAIGLVVTVGLVALTIIANHTILGMVVLPFTAPLAILAAVVCDGIMKGQAGDKWGTIGLYGLMVLFGSLLYGVVVFVVLRHRFRKRLRAS